MMKIYLKSLDINLNVNVFMLVLLIHTNGIMCLMKEQVPENISAFVDRTVSN